MLTPQILTETVVKTSYRQIQYPNGFVCKYTVVNDTITSISMYSPLNIALSVYIEDIVPLQNKTHWDVNRQLESKRFYLKTENELLSFNKFDHLYCELETVVFDRYNQIVPSAISFKGIYSSYYPFPHDLKNMTAFIKHIETVAEVLTPLELSPIPYYNCDSSCLYEEQQVADGLIKVSLDVFKKFIKKSSNGVPYYNSRTMMEYFIVSFMDTKPELNNETNYTDTSHY